MKRTVFAAFAVFAIVLLAVGQEKENFDVFGIAGYGFGTGGLYVGPTTTTVAGELTKKQDNYLNFGNGLKLEGGADLKLMQHLYAQGAVSYSNGLWGINQVADATGVDKTTENFLYSTFGIKAILKPTFQVLDLFTMYTGFGIGLYFAGLTIHRTETGPGINLSARADDSEWPAFAFVESLGLEYPLTSAIIAFGELYCEEMNFMTRQRTITGSNYPAGSEWANQIINYQNNVTDRAEPFSTPGTNVAIRLGVRFPLL